jgi:prepilin signal peptidase PulO-like enzyme (type II secretory pathway)
MEVIQLALVAIIGLAFGSFANVLIWRLNDLKAPKFWQGRSVCPKCRKPIAFQDNIPLLSFMLLRGKCRQCGQTISPTYPLVELVTAGAFAISWYLSPSLLVLGIVFSLLVIFFSDLKYQLIPDEMVILGSLLGVWLVLPDWPRLVTHIAVGLASAAAFLLVVVVTRFRGMGLGDVKLAFLIGLVLGWPAAIISFWSAFMIGGSLASVLLLLKRTTITATMALGPFLIIGTLIAALWSEEILAIL